LATVAPVDAGAVENNEPLLTGNFRHYRPIRELRVVAFRH
jgi:hypothetical protein